MKVFVANVTDDNCSHWIWAYSEEPTEQQVAKRVMEYEGFEFENEVQDVKDAMENLTIEIFELEVDAT